MVDFDSPLAWRSRNSTAAPNSLEETYQDGHKSNFSREAFVMTRFPAQLLVFDTNSGKTIQPLSAVGDCDDVFYDQTRKRIYAIGGEGGISVFEQQNPDHYKESARISTVKGARTGFFSPELDRLFLAVRRQGAQATEVRVFAPAP